MISFTSLGHKLSSILHDTFTGAKAVESFIEKVNTPGNQVLAESITGLIPGGQPAVVIERTAFAVSGEVAAILHTANGEKALTDVGFDAQVIADFKALIAGVPAIYKAAKAANTVA